MWDTVSRGVVGFPAVFVGWYAASWALGFPVRPGEGRIVKAWVSGFNAGDRWWLKHVSQGGLGLQSRLWSIAWRYQTPAGWIMVLNLDHFGGPVGWMVTRRLRRLLDRTARRMDVTVVPVPFHTWDRITREVRRSVWDVVERRGRECVFSKELDGKKEFFLSGFDSNEFPHLYFLTELPRPAESIADAREALKPRSVVMAEKSGRQVLRQGDMFAIPTGMSEADLKELGGRIETVALKVGSRTYGGTPLYGTAHTAEKVASLPDGTQFARGALYHEPSLIEERRRPDHRPCRLKKGVWYLVVKNATPMVQPRRWPAPLISMSTSTVTFSRYTTDDDDMVIFDEAEWR